MGFMSLLEVATMPILQVIIISVLGSILATEYFNLLHADARRHMNKIVFTVFTPSLMFASLAKTVTLQDIISWWFMPVNIGITFLIGGCLGWILVKLAKPEPYLEGLIIATCSAGNLGNLLLIVVPAICNEEGSPFRTNSMCSSIGLSYASFSMALGGFYIWSYTYHLIRTSGVQYQALQLANDRLSQSPNKSFDTNEKTQLLLSNGADEEQIDILIPSPKSFNERSGSGSLSRLLSSTKSFSERGSQKLLRHLSKSFNERTGSQAIFPNESIQTLMAEKQTFMDKITGVFHQIVEELLAPPTVAAIIGFIFGATPFLRNLIIGDNAPLRVIQDSVKLLGDGTIPCITLILGGNLTQGLRSGRLKPKVIAGILSIRYLILPVIGMGVVKVAGDIGILPADRLFRYVLMVQFTLPPAMNIGTMTQLFDVGQEECSVIFMWTYLVAAFALTIWSTVYMVPSYTQQYFPRLTTADNT